MISYSKQTKEALLETHEKKNCCRRIVSDLCALSGATEEEVFEKIQNSAKFFKCQNCFAAFLKGLFLSFGSVTDPEKQYHLELSFAGKKIRDFVHGVISEEGVEMASAERRGRYILYMKDSGKIEEFFALVGANKAAFDLINSKIIKELREDANRQSNCDMANIKKTLSASEKYIAVIEELERDGSIIRLPADLRETAKLRMENHQASMAELALLHSVPISKSGVKHRLDKIVDIAEEYKKAK